MAVEAKPEAGEMLRRPMVPYSSLPELSKPFLIDPSRRSFKHQYANVYFVRLVELRPIVEDHAKRLWAERHFKPRLLPRILDLNRGQPCFIVGTVYMDMPLKPNVLEDMARSNWIAPPAPRPKFYSSQDAVHLEDESGRVRLVGEVIRKERDREGGGFVTGVIMGALGFENSSGDFEVMELCFAGMPGVYHPSSSGVANGKGKAKESMDIENGDKPESKTWVALVSGLSVGNETSAPDLKSELLVEWLMGENGGAQDQLAGSRIARVVFVGNTLAAPVKGQDDRKIKRFGSGTQKADMNHPTKNLAHMLSDLLASSLPVNLVPGPSDPCGAVLPQQPMPKVMFGGKKMEGLECNTNPTWLEIGDRSFLCSGGQTIDDVFKYLPGKSRLPMAQRTLEWRHIAPTAPDTLWIYPFPDNDPFIIRERPNVYVVGNQPEFETALVGDEDKTRIVMLPSFAATGTVALVCLETLEVQTVSFEVPPWIGEVKVEVKED